MSATVEREFTELPGLTVEFLPKGSVLIDHRGRLRCVEEDHGYATNCWIWQGATSSAGYGRVNRKRTYFQAHRLAYVERYGPIPIGLELDHLCRVRNCVNPTHLEPVTRAENLQRGERTRLTKLLVETIRESSETTIWWASVLNLPYNTVWHARHPNGKNWR